MQMFADIVKIDITRTASIVDPEMECEEIQPHWTQHPQTLPRNSEEIPPKRSVFIFDDKKWTFQEVDLLTYAIANFFNESGIRQGHVVALVMENRPDLVFYWMGLAKIGAIAALINFNLREKSLLHCVQAAQAQCVVFSEEMAPAVADISRDLPKSCRLYYMGGGQCPVVGAVSLDPLQFDGYVSKEATEKKVAMNVFKKGDMAFLTGAEGRAGSQKLNKTTLQQKACNPPHKLRIDYFT
ncbi:hypothetical protein DPMN_156513 [Dreissena polymorpha]|uniref:Long-chain-fatty-acid--CoA ligase n=1 Tax=Dreissena polymorpha TaxID=45954 RepID=A0A9D4FPX8_DREPO|nr:hypothetical protein DPMN_156513 [Dreissena polymorpha]